MAGRRPLIDQSKPAWSAWASSRKSTSKPRKCRAPDDQIDVNYSVEEQASARSPPASVFAQNAGLILGRPITPNNFLGTGNKVSLGLTRSEYQSSFSFGFVDHTGRRTASAWLTTPSSVRTIDELNTDVSSYSVDSYGAGVSVGYPISDTSRLTCGLRFRTTVSAPVFYTVDEIFDFIEAEGDSYLNLQSVGRLVESTLNRGVLANPWSFTKFGI